MSWNIEELVPLAKLYDVQRTSLCRASKEFCKTKRRFSFVKLISIHFLSFYRKKVRLRSSLNLFLSHEATRRLSFYLRIIILTSAEKEWEKNDVQTIFTIHSFDFLAINCPPLTTVYYITGGDINFIKRALLAHGRSTAVSQLPRLPDNATGKKRRHVQMAPGRTTRA